MDPRLLKEHASFKKRSLATPSVESRKTKDKIKSRKEDVNKKSQKRSYSAASSSLPKTANSSFDYKTVTLRPKNRFTVLATIVNEMKRRHLEGEFEPLSIDEILDRIKYTDIDPNDKSWLANQALINNDRLTIKGGKFLFKPVYHMKNKRQFIDVLQKHYNEGGGGLLYDDVEESLPSAEKIVRSTTNKNIVLKVTRPTDKKIVLFHNDIQHSMVVDEKFKELWRHSSVEGMGEGDIENYLVNHGISTMKDSAFRKPPVTVQKKKSSQKKKQFKIQNVHLEQGLLKDFNDVKNK